MLKTVAAHAVRLADTARARKARSVNTHRETAP